MFSVFQPGDQALVKRDVGHDKMIHGMKQSPDTKMHLCFRLELSEVVPNRTIRGHCTKMLAWNMVKVKKISKTLKLCNT